ncbi:hypothetical protein NLG97_g3564 [Lecanicillium saksenae]|uniref:Uncharacterized protein n=1 Tax=Lecanicillium saksenae TaxID=468837 RepID=A0ACC1R0D9_9HYPO|nr:hypothetical protein NLG97_g3564 [Lecanicillium saksenae]
MAAQLVATLLPTQPSKLGRDVAEGSLEDVRPWSEPRFIVQSPYTELKHQLDLTTLDYENALLAKALSTLDATREDYAIAPYNESFNWADVIARLKSLVSIYGQQYQDTTFYIVAFRSQIKPSTDYSHLGELDKAAHLEAVESGGFLKYWFGSPDSELRNLATCLWRSKEDAFAGGRGPAHRKAAMSTRSLYAYWKIDQHRLTIRNNAEDWEIVPWVDEA